MAKDIQITNQYRIEIEKISMSSESNTNVNASTETEELRAIFDYYDVDGNGAISIKELGDMMKSLGKDVTESELLDLMEEIDRDGTGSISFDEFQAMSRKFVTDDPKPEELEQIFRMFDSSCTGYFTATNLKTLINLLGEEATDDDINEMINIADVDNDGKVSEEDFITLMTSANN